VMLFGFMSANAAGTDYGTDITNSVTLSYDVGGNTQPDINANDGAGFKVDRKVDVLVATTNPNNQVVNPGDNLVTDDHALTFTVTNETNGDQDFILSLENLATGVATLDAGETDNMDLATDLKVCTDNPCTNDVTGLNQSFAEDQTRTYYVFADVPIGTASGWASIALKATAVDDGTTNIMTDDSADPDSIAAVDIVFAEEAGVAAGDTVHHGEHSAFSTYEVEAAILAVTKTSCVLNDPVNGTTNPKRIPGATIWYQLEVTNTGTGAAENVEIADTLNAAFGNSATNIAVHNGACPALTANNNCGARVGAAEGNAHTGAGSANVTVNFEDIGAAGSGTDVQCGYIEVVIQ